MAASGTGITRVWLKCCECGQTCLETFDNRCSACWYCHSGGDLGIRYDIQPAQHAVVRGNTIDWKAA